MRKRAIIVGLAGAATVVGVGLFNFGPFAPVFYRPTSVSANGGVDEIDIQPIPEGPGLVLQRTPTSPRIRSLAQIEQFIPDPLPAPLFQGLCGMGGDMVVILGNGLRVTYGPCYRPAAINRLWAEIYQTSGY